MAKLKETTARFDDLKADLTTVLEDIGQQAEETRIESALGSDIITQCEELKSICSNIEAQKSKVDDLKSAGEDILAILDALDCKETPKGIDIQTTISNVMARYNNLHQTALVKQKKLDEKAIQSLLDWAKKTQTIFKNMNDVSLDRDTLNEQVQRHREIMSDVDKHQTDVTTVLERCEGKSPHILKCKSLSKLFGEVNSKAKDRGAVLEDVVQKLEPFNLAVYQIESWHSYVIHSIKAESTDLSFLFTKIDNLFKQRKEKHEHLESINTIGQKLLEDTNCGDKDKLKESIEQFQGKWDEIGQEMIKFVSSAAEREISGFSKWLEKSAKDLEAAEAPSCELEEVTKQYTDHQAGHEELKKKHKLTLNVVNTYKTIYKELTGNEPEEIQAKWLSVLKEMMAVSNRSEERMGVLQEAQPAQMSADIEMDEVLPEWIEVDTVRGDGDKKKNHGKASATSTPKKIPSKTPSKGGRSSGKSATDTKTDSHKHSSGKDDKKGEGRKESELKKESGSRKSHSESKKKESDSKKDGEAKKEDTKSDGSKKSDQKDSKDQKSSGSKEGTKKSGSSSKASDHKEGSKSSSSKEDAIKVQLFAGKNTPTLVRYGIVICNIKETTSASQVREFVKSQAIKAGLIKMYQTPNKKSPQVFVGLNRSYEVNKCVRALSGKTLQGVKVTVKKAIVCLKPDDGSPSSIFDAPGPDRDEKKVDKNKRKDDIKKEKSSSSSSSMFDTATGSKKSAQGSSKKSEDKSKKSEDKSKKSDDKPKKSEDKPKKSEDKPKKSEDKPKKSEDTPKKSEDKPKKSEDKPKKSEDKPKKLEDKKDKKDDKDKSDDKKDEKSKDGDKKFKVLSLKEIHKRKELRTGRRPAQGASGSRQATGNRPTRRGGRVARNRPDAQGGRRKMIFTLTELRQRDRNRRAETNRGNRQVIDRRSPPLHARNPRIADDRELERERQRVRLEQERLERERVQAERERIALERERQRRDMDRMNYFPGEPSRESMRHGKRALSPPRDDGSYWIQPKRNMMERDMGYQDPNANRRQINTAYDDRTLSHLRFDDLRPMPPPGRVPMRHPEEQARNMDIPNGNRRPPYPGPQIAPPLQHPIQPFVQHQQHQQRHLIQPVRNIPGHREDTRLVRLIHGPGGNHGVKKSAGDGPPGPRW